LVHNYVLSDFAKSENQWVAAMIAACIKAMPVLLDGEREKYQNEVMRLAPAPKPVSPSED
jgi:peptidyl-tRNA hydrolase